MHNETLFYICAIALAVSAVAVSFLGLKVKGFPGRAFPLVVLWFALLVASSTTFAVLHAQDEEKAKAAETVPAGEEIEAEEEDVEAAEAGEEAGGAAQGGTEGKQQGGAATTLKLAADPTAIAYDKTSLTAEAGEVTIDFDNPSAIPHDVAIEQNGKEIAVTAQIAEAEESLSVDLEPGAYTFLCTVPGHAEAGMEGTLTVK